jgi:hypothetical protein
LRGAHTKPTGDQPVPAKLLELPTSEVGNSSNFKLTLAGRSRCRTLVCPGLALLAALVVVAVGCGAADGSAGPTSVAPGQSVAPAAAGGTFALNSIKVGGRPRPVSFFTEFDIDTEFGTLSVATDCGVLLGSFSLLADGRAGITLAGGRSHDCAAGASEQQQELVAALGRVDTWATNDTRLSFVNSMGDRVELTRT